MAITSIGSGMYYPLAVCFILIIWFETNAVYEYCRAFGLGRFFKGYTGFVETTAPSTTLVEYLMIKRDCFFVRLISCPICLSVWMSVVVAIIYSSGWVFFVNFYLSLILYFLFKALMRLSRHGT